MAQDEPILTLDKAAALRITVKTPDPINIIHN